MKLYIIKIEKKNKPTLSQIEILFKIKSVTRCLTKSN